MNKGLLNLLRVGLHTLGSKTDETPKLSKPIGKFWTQRIYIRVRVEGMRNEVTLMEDHFPIKSPWPQLKQILLVVWDTELQGWV